MKKQLCKSRKNKMIAGVCGGIAEYFNIDATIVRLVFGILTIFWCTGIIVYILAAIVIPTSDEPSDEENVDNLKSANIDESEEGAESPKSKTKTAPHTDQEFDAFFKK